LEGNTSITLILKYNDSSKLCYLKRCILVYLIVIKTNDWPHFEQHQCFCCFFRPDHEMVKFPVKSAVTTGYHWFVILFSASLNVWNFLSTLLRLMNLDLIRDAESINAPNFYLIFIWMFPCILMIWKTKNTTVGTVSKSNRKIVQKR
jgi:hypothetical protein